MKQMFCLNVIKLQNMTKILQKTLTLTKLEYIKDTADVSEDNERKYENSENLCAVTDICSI